MKKVYTILAILATTAASGQTWYQKEKKFHPFIAGAAAVGNVKMFRDIKVLQGADIWSAVEVGMVNKNTSFGVALTSYEWATLKDTYLGLVAQRRMFYIGRLETWISAAYGMSLTGQLEPKFQPAIRERLHLHKNVALEVSYQQTLDERQNWSLNAHRAVAVGVNIAFHGNVNSNNK